MRPSLSINIDEAGDPGARDGLRYRAGRHEWLCLGAVIVRTSRDGDLEDWLGDLRAAARSRQAPALHYARITPERRQSVAQLLATKPCRCAVVVSHKSNLRQYVNPRIGAMLSSANLYNWCVRLLLERISSWAEPWQLKNVGKIEPLEVNFEERGGHDYEHMFAYIDRLRMQAETGTLFLRGRKLHPEHLDRRSWRAVGKESSAGLQLADTVASAFYQAANIAAPTHDVGPAQALKPVMLTDGVGSHVNSGVTVWPLAHQAPIPEEARAIFEFYGYHF
jgi:hypothetical protein